MKLTGGNFERWLGLEGGAPMKAINTIFRAALDCCHVPAAMWGRNEWMAVHEPGSWHSPDTKSASTMILDSHPELQEVNFCCFKPPHLWYFCYCDWMDYDISVVPSIPLWHLCGSILGWTLTQDCPSLVHSLPSSLSRSHPKCYLLDLHISCQLHQLWEDMDLCLFSLVMCPRTSASA